MAGGEIFIEILPAGHASEVVAIDADTALEVRFIVPSTASDAEIKSLARAKISYVKSRQSEGPDSPKPPKRGIIV